MERGNQLGREEVEEAWLYVEVRDGLNVSGTSFLG
jgi:hypothetical protein